MIQDPERYIQAFADAGSDIITVHVESTKHIHRALQMIRNAGKKSGLHLIQERRSNRLSRFLIWLILFSL